MMILRTLLALVLASVPLLADGTTQAAATEPLVRRVQAMGTWLEIRISHTSREEALALSARVVHAVHEAERRLSTWSDASELAAFNRHPPGQWASLSPALASDLGAALHWAQLTNGAFDPTLGSLIEAWDLRGRGCVPSVAELAEARTSSGLEKLELEEFRGRRLTQQLRLEEGGFGKGAALGHALESLDPDSPACVHLDFGGQIARSARCPEIEISIADPGDRQTSVGSVWVGPGSVASSGQSEHRIVVDETAYGHVLDPRSGRPAPAWGSVTVIHPDPLAADCLATALFVMGPEHAQLWLEQHPEIRAVLVEGRGIEARLKTIGGQLQQPSQPVAPGGQERKSNSEGSADSP